MELKKKSSGTQKSDEPCISGRATVICLDLIEEKNV